MGRLMTQRSLLPYRDPARDAPPRVTPHEEHAHHHKDKVIVSAIKVIITRFFIVVTQ